MTNANESASSATSTKGRRTSMDGNRGVALLITISGLFFGIVLVLALGPALQRNYAGSTSAERPLQVVTSLGLFADLVNNVGGNSVEVTALIPAEADPHAWDPSIAQIRAIAQADVFIYNGLGLEPWVERTLAGVARSDLVIVRLSDGVTSPSAGQSERAENNADPHMWLDIQNAITYVRSIAAALSAGRPADAASFKERAADYVDQLTALDEWFQEQVDAIPPERRILITDHDAYVYMAQRYGLTQGGFLVRNPDREPSAREMARLIETVRRLHVPAVFAEPHIGTSFIDQLARETGVSIGTLYTDALTRDVATYIDMMRANGNTLREHLGGAR